MDLEQPAASGWGFIAAVGMAVIAWLAFFYAAAFAARTMGII